MSQIEMSAEFDCDSETLWTIIGDPGRADWVAGISSCVYDGECRTLTMAGAGTLVERIHRLDAKQHVIDYGVVQSAAPLTHHRAVMSLSPSPTGTTLHWQTEVRPDKYASFIEQGMRAGIEGLQALVLKR